MRRLARLALKLLTGASSVFIAACYGVPYDERWLWGEVRDAQTLAPIAGIRVACLDEGGEVSSAMTDGAGEFHVPGTCAELRAEDVDGAANGAYAPKTVPASGLSWVELELEPLP
jgi:hypothetical protein